MIDLNAVGYGNGLIYVGMPRERFFIPQFVDNRDAVLTNIAASGVGCGYHQSEGHRVDRNRDQIVKAFLRHEKKPEWLLMLDTDMEHPVDCGQRLAAWKKPIVGALYFHRGQSHDPFAFLYAGKRKDENGRMTHTWAPMRDIVYEFLEDNMVPIRDGGLVIDKPIRNPLLECDAVGTGCFLVHRSVLEEIPFPWFEYREGGNSEDLMFCKMAKDEYEIPVYCDLSTICGHYSTVPLGQAQFRMNYINRGINLTTYSKLLAAGWWAKAFGTDEDEAVKQIEAGNVTMVGPLWKARFGNKAPSAEEVTSFYQDPDVGKAYVMELLHWNFLPQYNVLRKPLTDLRGVNVLEIGAGIGTASLQLWLQKCNVIAAEINQVLRDFIDLRYQQLAELVVGEVGQFSIVDETWIEKMPAESQDAVVCLETFEHIHKDSLAILLNAIWDKLKPGGFLYFSTNWGQQEVYPMHYDHTELFAALCAEIGFELIRNGILRKVNHDLGSKP